LGEGIQIRSREGDSSSPRGENSERVKIHNLKKKTSSSEPEGQIQLNLVQIILE
jgi:hypothetical protein